MSRADQTAIIQIRTATRAIHDDLERVFDAVEELASLEGKRRMLPRYALMYGRADDMIGRFLKADEMVGFSSPRRRLRLQADLEALGLQATVNSFAEPLIETRAEAIGFLYVIEGSMLGGHMIVQSLLKRNTDMIGLAFLDPYGDATGEAWRRFRIALAEWLGDNDKMIAQAVSGAVKGFTFAFQCLAPESITPP